MMRRVGWVVDSSPQRILKWPWQKFSSVGKIRYDEIARYIGKNLGLTTELYRPWRSYDAVVFVKMMNPSCQRLMQKLQSKRIKVVFDANVNYYEEQGDYVVPGTRPTTEQKKWAVQMTSQADLVVADSVYLKTVCEKINRNVVWIPDAVDTDFFLPAENKKNRPGGKLVLVWSGMAKKARPLEYIEQVLCELKNNVVLKIITGPKDTRNPWADVITRLVEKGVAETVLYKHDEYAGVLQEADAIISPRTLENTYEMAHTEYKITLGMSAGLPALASEQPAYVEALKDGGGFLCRSQEEWKEKIRWLIENPRERVAMGLKARDVVLRRFSIPVVAAQYQKALRGLFN